MSKTLDFLLPDALSLSEQQLQWSLQRIQIFIEVSIEVFVTIDSIYNSVNTITTNYSILSTIKVSSIIDYHVDTV